MFMTSEEASFNFFKRRHQELRTPLEMAEAVQVFPSATADRKQNAHKLMAVTKEISWCGSSQRVLYYLEVIRRQGLLSGPNVSDLLIG